MALSIHFTTRTVKELAAAWQQALRRGDPRPLTRITALRLVGERRAPAEVAAFVQCAESTVYAWVAAFVVQGCASFTYRRSPGRPPKLTASQKAQLRIFLDAGPEAAGYTTGAWSSPLVQTLIQQQFGVLYNVHYVSGLLHSLGYSYQKARFVSDHLDEAARTHWLAAQWPAIVQAAHAQGALLLFGDEASFAQWGSLSYSWARCGEQPCVKTSGRRKGYKVWGLVDWFSGQVFYAGHSERFTAESYCHFLAHVLAQTTQPVVLVQDGARYHTAKKTQEWMAQQADRLTVYQLPSYSPDYNPIEHLWRYVKEGTHCAYFASFEELVGRVETRLAQLRDNAQRVQRLLGSPLDSIVSRQTYAA